MVCDWLSIKGREGKKGSVSQAWFQIHNYLPKLFPKSHSFLQIKKKKTTQLQSIMLLNSDPYGNVHR